MEDALKYSLLLALASVLLMSSSCSWYRSLERSLVEDDQKQVKARPVTRQQYDQLLVKYEELSKKYEELKEGKPKSSLVDEINNTQSENFSQGVGNVETVNLFPAGNEANQAVPSDVESQLGLFRRGLALKNSNPGEATKIFQQLEAQGVPAVKVRARLQIGELLLGKQQYDLALQVFEDIINKSSYSGAVLDALRYAVVCTDKLGIQNKKDQYTSMLVDVFETN
jgi:tetratricopeptide (TPR) repeat protein